VSTLVTIEQLTFELEQARQLAMVRGNASAAVMAVIAKAKLHGLTSDRTGVASEQFVEIPRPPQTNREIARLIAFALAIGRERPDEMSGPAGPLE
jgi:phage terminase small subunit